MIKSASLKAVSFGFFLVSLFYSISIMASQARDPMALILAVVSAILLDTFEMFSFYFAYIDFQAKKIGTGTIFALLFITLFIMSVVASLGQMYNTDIQSTALDVERSSGYVRTQERYDMKVVDIEDLKQEYNATMENYDAQINSLPDDYLTRKAELRDEKNQVLANIQARVDAANNELQEISASFDTIDADSVNVSGYTAIFDYVAKMINETSYATKEYTSQDISFVFFTALSIIFEISAVMCFLKAEEITEDVDAGFSLSKKASDDNASPTPSNGKPKLRKPNNLLKVSKIRDKPKLETEVVTAAAVDLKTTNEQKAVVDLSTTDEYKAYVRAMIDNIKVSAHEKYKYEAIGYPKIGEIANLNNTQATQIYNYLKESGDVVVTGLRTYMNSEKLIELCNEKQAENKNRIGFI